MATEPLIEQASASDLGLHFKISDHNSAWESLSAHERMKLIDDDLEAGRNVSIVFFSSIFVGLLLTIAAVVVLLRSV